MPETADVTTMLPPGEQLRLKRLEFGLQAEDIANELFLSVSQVESIEAGNHENLPGPTYIMGYWRSYAGLLNIDLTEVIEKYRDSLQIPSSGIVLEPHHQRVHGHQEKSRKKSALRFFILSGLFLGLIWYWQNPQDNPFQQWMQNQANSKLNMLNSASTEAIQDVEEQQSDDISDQIIVLERKDADVAAPEPNFSDDFSGQDPAQAEGSGALILINPVTSVDPDQVFELEATNPDVEVAVVEVVEVVEVNAEPNALPKVESDQSATTEAMIQQEQQALQEIAAVTEQGPVDTSSTHWLILKVNAPTWLDVRDRSGEKLIYRTAKLGEDLELNGTPPFAVFIGNSTAVVVEYLGEQVEFEADEEGTFARFLVGDYE